MMCSCDQLRKLVAQVWPVRRMSLEPYYKKIDMLYDTDIRCYVVH